MQKLVLDIIKGYECQTSPPGYVPRLPSLVFREHPPAHCNDSGVPRSESRCRPCGIHNPRQALALCVAKFEVCARCHLCPWMYFMCGAFNDSIRERLFLPEPSKAMAKHRLMEISTVSRGLGTRWWLWIWWNRSCQKRRVHSHPWPTVMLEKAQQMSCHEQIAKDSGWSN